jgi:hypothetical protein
MSSRSCSRDKRLFKGDAQTVKESADHRGVGFDAPLTQQAITKRLKRDVRLLGPRSLKTTKPRRGISLNARWPLCRQAFESRPV